VVKYPGAAYLIYLGVRKLLDRTPHDEAVEAESQPLWDIFRQGVVVNTLNPKLALFFFAFLPQFVDPARGTVSIQFLLLGLLFVGMAIISDSLYAMLAGTLGQWLRQSNAFRWGQRYVSGGIYIALGLTAAFAGGKAHK
jgi:threonine/homoserine/homoserine lactone efflux protein